MEINSWESDRKEHEQLCANKLDKPEEMETFSETYNLPRLNKEEI